MLTECSRRRRTHNPRVRGSGPWRRTRSDLGFLPWRRSPALLLRPGANAFVIDGAASVGPLPRPLRRAVGGAQVAARCIRANRSANRAQRRCGCADRVRTSGRPARHPAGTRRRIVDASNDRFDRPGAAQSFHFVRAINPLGRLRTPDHSPAAPRARDVPRRVPHTNCPMPPR